MSDFYRSKLYRAERDTFQDLFEGHPRVERTVEECQERADWLAANCKAWILACVKYGHKSYAPKVGAARGHTSWANSGRWDIKLTNDHRGRDWVLVHEMCHLPIPNSFQSHGREFCELYIAMTEELYGPHDAERLATHMDLQKCVRSRGPKYERQLRGYFRTLAKPDYESTDVCVVTTRGKRCYGTPRLEGDHVYLSRSYTDATPGSIPLDEVAYVTWVKVPPYGTTRTGRRWDR
jgi:hypothetical protein